jgi:hypothetical protein
MEGEQLQITQPQNRWVPTYTRVWQFRWVIRGIPNGPTFWRPIDGWVAITFIVMLFVDWRLLRMIGWAPAFLGQMVSYIGVPALVATAVGRMNRGGKHLHAWVWDRLSYWAGPKVWDRLSSVEDGPEQAVTFDAPVAVWREYDWRTW